MKYNIYYYIFYWLNKIIFFYWARQQKRMFFIFFYILFSFFHKKNYSAFSLFYFHFLLSVNFIKVSPISEISFITYYIPFVSSFFANRSDHVWVNHSQIYYCLHNNYSISIKNFI